MTRRQSLALGLLLICTVTTVAVYAFTILVLLIGAPA